MDSLQERARMLAARREKDMKEPKGVGFRLDVLDRMIDLLNADPQLKTIFGDPVSAKLAVFSDGKTISIVESGLVPLDEAKKLKFLQRLKEINDSMLGGG